MYRQRLRRLINALDEAEIARDTFEAQHDTALGEIEAPKEERKRYDYAITMHEVEHREAERALALSQAATDAAIRIGERAQARVNTMAPIVDAAIARHAAWAAEESGRGGKAIYLAIAAADKALGEAIDANRAVLSPSPANEQANKELG